MQHNISDRRPEQRNLTRSNKLIQPTIRNISQTQNVTFFYIREAYDIAQPTEYHDTT